MHSEDSNWPNVIRNRNWIVKTEEDWSRLRPILERVFGAKCEHSDPDFDLDVRVHGSDLADSAMNVSGPLTEFNVHFSVNIMEMKSYITLYEDGTKRKLQMESRNFEYRESFEEVLTALFALVKPNLLHRM